MKVFSALLFPGMEEKPDPTQWKHFIYITVMLPDETLEISQWESSTYTVRVYSPYNTHYALMSRDNQIEKRERKRRV